MSIQSGPWAFHRLDSTELDNERTLVLYGEGGGGKQDEDIAKLESKYKAVSKLLPVHAVIGNWYMEKEARKYRNPE